jgi:3-methyladenine DNA glycosylase Tag
LQKGIRSLFGRLVLEINQAGLSWETILKNHAANVEPQFMARDRQRPRRRPALQAHRGRV